MYFNLSAKKILLPAAARNTLSQEKAVGEQKKRRARARRFHETTPSYLIPRSSTSKTSVALGGITPPAPLSPYARSGGIVSLRLPPTFIVATPSSQPLITCPWPSTNSNGWPRSTDESNFFPFVSHPV